MLWFLRWAWTSGCSSCKNLPGLFSRTPLALVASAESPQCFASLCAAGCKKARAEETQCSIVRQAWQEFDDDGRMKDSNFRDRVVDVMEEFYKSLGRLSSC